jgi:hypothetical protein
MRGTSDCGGVVMVAMAVLGPAFLPSFIVALLAGVGFLFSSAKKNWRRKEEFMD